MFKRDPERAFAFKSLREGGIKIIRVYPPSPPAPTLERYILLYFIFHFFNVFFSNIFYFFNGWG